MEWSVLHLGIFYRTTRALFNHDSHTTDHGRSHRPQMARRSLERLAGRLVGQLRTHRRVHRVYQESSDSNSSAGCVCGCNVLYLDVCLLTTFLFDRSLYTRLQVQPRRHLYHTWNLLPRQRVGGRSRRHLVLDLSLLVS